MTMMMMTMIRMEKNRCAIVPSVPCCCSFGNMVHLLYIIAFSTWSAKIQQFPMAPITRLFLHDLLEVFVLNSYAGCVENAWVCHSKERPRVFEREHTCSLMFTWISGNWQIQGASKARLLAPALASYTMAPCGSFCRIHASSISGFAAGLEQFFFLVENIPLDGGLGPGL